MAFADYLTDHPSIGVQRHEFVVTVGSLPSYIPARLLRLPGGVNFKQKTEMVHAACRRPHVNKDLIMNQGKIIFGLPQQVGAVPDPAGPVSLFGYSQIL